MCRRPTKLPASTLPILLSMALVTPFFLPVARGVSPSILAISSLPVKSFKSPINGAMLLIGTPLPTASVSFSSQPMMIPLAVMKPLFRASIPTSPQFQQPTKLKARSSLRFPPHLRADGSLHLFKQSMVAEDLPDLRTLLSNAVN